MLSDKDKRQFKQAESSEDNLREDVLEESKSGLDPGFVEKVERLYKELDSIDYYNFLNVERWSSPDRIRKAYYKVAKEFHPDRYLHVPSDTLQKKLNAIFSHLTELYKILTDPKMRMQYDQSLSGKPAKSQDSSKRVSNAELARIRFREGEEAFRQKSYSEAEALFNQAVYLDGSVPAYYFSLGLVFRNQKKFHDAGKAINQALKIDPGNRDYLVELGHIYLELEFKLRARSVFEKIIKSDPFNQRAAEGLLKIKDNHK